MVASQAAPWPLLALMAAGVVGAILVGVELRLRDPLSSPVLPAEDTYNHMALTREHVRDGSLDPLNPGSRLYPPGMHVLVAAAWIYTGSELYDLFRFGPVVLGAVGILGMGLFLWRFHSPVAGFVGAVGYAVVPEIAFRTTMMAPTAVDLALLPYLLFALLRLLQGRLAYAAPTGALVLFTVFSHPWMLSILVLAGLIFVPLALVFRWPASQGARVGVHGLAAAIAILGVGWALSVNGCGGYCGPGFDDVYEGGEELDRLALPAGAFSLLAALVLSRSSRRVDEFLTRPARARPLVPLAVLGCVILAAGLLAAAIPAFVQGLPSGVGFDFMFGWPILVLSAVGFIALPFLRSPAGYVGAAFAIVTLPFVIYDPFTSEFWSHRTAVYLGFAMVILGAVAVGGLAMTLAQSLPARRVAGSRIGRRASRSMAAAAPAVVLALVFASGVYAGTPQGDRTWYRLFTPCEHDALSVVADRAANETSAVVVTGDWQSKLVIASLTHDASRVWYTDDFFTSQQSRDSVAQNPNVVVVVDKYLLEETPRAELGFLESSPWTRVGQWCPHPADPTVIAYTNGDPNA